MIYRYVIWNSEVLPPASPARSAKARRYLFACGQVSEENALGRRRASARRNTEQEPRHFPSHDGGCESRRQPWQQSGLSCAARRQDAAVFTCRLTPLTESGLNVTPLSSSLLARGSFLPRPPPLCHGAVWRLGRSETCTTCADRCPVRRCFICLRK